MSLEETVSRSLLDKPLHQLTEEDISQITREDCRRYLKEKGMRRPSWNKSQAIQQVISLKTLLETTPDSDSGTRSHKKLYIPRPPENLHIVQKARNADTPTSVPADESVPYGRKDPEKHDVSGDLPCHQNLNDGEEVPPRTTDARNGLVGQMIIFYCGKVNVYDDVPADKAHVLMQLAASPLHVPPEDPLNGTTARQTFPCHLEASSGKVGPEAPVVILPTLHTLNIPDKCRLHREESSTFREENSAEGPASRKASVQRYLEKRKDRFKSKRKAGTPSSASFDIYLNHQVGSQTLNELPSKSDTCSPGQIRPPNTPTQCDFVEDNEAENANLSADLNAKDP